MPMEVEACELQSTRRWQDRLQLPLQALQRYEMNRGMMLACLHLFQLLFKERTRLASSREHNIRESSNGHLPLVNTILGNPQMDIFLSWTQYQGILKWTSSSRENNSRESSKGHLPLVKTIAGNPQRDISLSWKQ